MSRLVWENERSHWPHAEHSQFVSARKLRWHVQRFSPTAATASTPCVLLVHGTGASAHSWRHNVQALAEHAHVLAIDLPGHGFTERPAPGGLSLVGMANHLAALLDALGFEPSCVIGHSAGAAVLVRMTLDGRIAPQHIVSLNGALYPFRGATQRLFPSIARALFLNPLVPRVFALGAGRASRVARLIEGTGSHLDDAGLALYGRLFASPDHAAAALGMMARWDLDGLDRDIAALSTPLTLVVADNDRAVPPARANDLAARLPGASTERLAALGHLAHEEAPDRVNALLIDRITAGSVAGEAS